MRRQFKGEAVRHELLAGESTELLKELHILTRTGDLNADSNRKLKQVNHLIGLLIPAVDDVMERFGAPVMGAPGARCEEGARGKPGSAFAPPIIVDCGAGKSYLGFILYEVFLKAKEKGALLSIESRPELTSAASERAQRLGFARLSFQTAAIDAAVVPERVHLVTALHACDTATDDALALAIQHNADHIAVVPCCQAEVARQLEVARGTDPAIAALCERPWHRREFGSHLTNVVRALVLEAKGYKVTVTELAGWEHSLKNELILAKKMRAYSTEAEAKLRDLLAAAGVAPKLARVLGYAPESAPAS